MKALMLLLGRVRAFVVRDFQLAVSYRLEFFMRILSILFVTTTLYFISQISPSSTTSWSASQASPTPYAPSRRKGHSKAF